MHNIQAKMQFVKLKAEGMPMYKIAKAIGVHRTTLTLWHKELAEFILIAKQDYIDELLFENNNTKLCRIESISRHISDLYQMLDAPWELRKIEMTYDEVLNAITKYTKLLHMEYNEKPLHRLIKNADREKMNNENSEPKEAPVWITDMEAFREIQPEENNPEEIEIDYVEPDPLNLYEKMEVVRDISEEDPKIQKIFERTQIRTMFSGKREAYLKEDEEHHESISGNKIIKQDVKQNE